jgi:hypothetical protein
MADIDFKVDSREIRSLDDDMREPWLEEGMNCGICHFMTFDIMPF